MKRRHVFEAELVDGCPHKTFKESMHDDVLIVNWINLWKGRHHANNQQCEKLEYELGCTNKLEPPSLKKIKQEDLNEKYCHLLPQEFRDITCPKSPDDVIDCAKGVQK